MCCPVGRRCAHRGCLWRLARSASPRPRSPAIPDAPAEHS